jgi:hypothetical protein
VIKRIYRQEEAEGVQGCTILEPYGGPKRYKRIWDNSGLLAEWGWSLHPTAVLVWENPEAREYGDDAASDPEA